MTLKKKDRTELEDLIRAFYFNDTQMKKYKTVSDEEKARIKELMKEGDITDMVVGDLKAKYITSVKDSMDEAKLLEVLKKYNLTDCIKTVEVVDMDALENAIYHNTVPNAALKKMDDCRQSTTTVSLRVSKVR